MKMRSIAYVCNEYPEWIKGGGIGVYTKEIAECLAEYGCKVFIIGCSEEIRKTTVTKKNNIYIKGIVYHEIPRIAPWFNRIRLSIHLRVLIYRYKIDLIECPEYLGWLWPIRPRIPVVIRFHSSTRMLSWQAVKEGLPMSRSAKFELHTIRQGKVFCAVSDFLKGGIKQSVPGMDEKDIAVIPNGIDTRFFCPGTLPERDPTQVVFVGRVSEPKGVPELLRAWERVLTKRPGAKLRLIGRDSPAQNGRGSFIEELKQTLPSHLLRSVQFTGPMDRVGVRDSLRKCALCVFPSHREAHPIAVLEAMSCGCAVICSDHSGFRDLIDHTSNGLLCDTTDAQGFAESILHLLYDARFRKELGEKARATAVERFDLNKTLKQNLALYECALNGAAD